MPLHEHRSFYSPVNYPVMGGLRVMRGRPTLVDFQPRATLLLCNSGSSFRSIYATTCSRSFCAHAPIYLHRRFLTRLSGIYLSIRTARTAFHQPRATVSLKASLQPSQRANLEACELVRARATLCDLPNRTGPTLELASSCL